MNVVPIHPIETSRLRLRLIRDSDLMDYHHRLTSDRLVTQYMLSQPRDDIAHTAGTIRRIRAGNAAGDRRHWAIALKEKDSLIGTIALLRFDPEEETCSFAYMLGRDFWGRGYGTEALKAVFRFAFEEMEVRKIEADHFAENSASGAVMRKAGMRETGILPGHYEKDGVMHDAVRYRITKEEWEKDTSFS